MKTKIADLIKSLGFDSVANEYLQGLHTAQASLAFVANCLKGDKKRQLIAITALQAVTKENL